MPRPARQPLRACVVMAVCALAAGGASHAKDVRRLWFAGGSFAYHTTDDAIRSDATLEADPRPDHLAGRETALEDTLQYGLHAGFGLSPRVALHLEAGWFRSEVGPLDAFLGEQYPAASNTAVPHVLNVTRRVERSIPFVAGEMTQIPVSLTGTLRFRKDRNFNPFVGAGLGMVFMEFEPRDGFYEVNRRLERMRIVRLNDARGNKITPPWYEDRIRLTDDRIPMIHSLTYDVDNASQWHLSAGFEQSLTDRLGLVVDARYHFFNKSKPLKLRFEHVPGTTDPYRPRDQINFLFHPEALFREDGSLLIFNDKGNSPNPVIPGDPKGGRYTCVPGEFVDIDDDLRVDFCYEDKPSSEDDAIGQFLVQGGEIDLSGFTIQLGLRWYF
ncbi:MAG TPA: hypothetical protein VJV23_01180 [Candidatus Polarisedimenticolia bacterium]|nr:hypothetical protein [Candidatus Polarisedimenticolia bacterium]